MSGRPVESATGLLLSGGLDSSILLATLLREGCRVQPFYVRSQLVWETEELHAVDRCLAVFSDSPLEPLVVLDLPLGDLYGDHWSVTGCEPPDASTRDEAVYLPGRNALLVVKAALWCQLHGFQRLALGVLASNPFGDSTPQFFDHLESALNCGAGTVVRIIRPFERFDKRRVMELGRDLPLEKTFSCIAPRGGRHCGQCNKCAERRAAFRLISMKDPTRYAVPMTTGV
ncbi:MAG: 7-cyano-7-deazaguanine synthase [Planctomycetota bacterium]|jgi:7-cyano-7-deazaguanine synthase